MRDGKIGIEGGKNVEEEQKKRNHEHEDVKRELGERWQRKNNLKREEYHDGVLHKLDSSECREGEVSEGGCRHRN